MPLGRPRKRRVLARKVSLYAALVILVSLWAGIILAFFGTSLGPLRVAGGVVVVANAWRFLQTPSPHEDPKDHPGLTTFDPDIIAFSR